MNFLKIQRPFFWSRRIVFKEVILGLTVDLTDSSRSTVAMIYRFANRCLKLVIVQLQMKASDASTSQEERVASFRLPVGFSSGGHDASRSPLVANDLSRSNS